VDDFIKYYYRNGAHLGLTSSIKHYSPVASSLAFGRLPQQPQLQQHRFVAAAAANSFYRAMHFSAKRGIAIACRLSVCLSVCNVGEL